MISEKGMGIIAKINKDITMVQKEHRKSCESVGKFDPVMSIVIAQEQIKIIEEHDKTISNMKFDSDDLETIESFYDDLTKTLVLALATQQKLIEIYEEQLEKK